MPFSHEVYKVALKAEVKRAFDAYTEQKEFQAGQQSRFDGIGRNTTHQTRRYIIDSLASHTSKAKSMHEYMVKRDKQLASLISLDPPRNLPGPVSFEDKCLSRQGMDDPALREYDHMSHRAHGVVLGDHPRGPIFERTQLTRAQAEAWVRENSRGPADLPQDTTLFMSAHDRGMEIEGVRTGYVHAWGRVADEIAEKFMKDVVSELRFVALVRDQAQVWMFDAYIVFVEDVPQFMRNLDALLWVPRKVRRTLAC